MASRSLGLVATFGLAANAFLLPPAMSTDNADMSFDAMRAGGPFTLPYSYQLNVSCIGCTAEGPSTLSLDFNVGSQPGTLELGGRPVYPPSAFLTSGSDGQPTAVSVSADGQQQSTLPISMWTFTTHTAFTVSETGEELLAMDMHITRVDNKPVTIPTVHLQAFKLPEGTLKLLPATVDEHVEANEKGESTCQSKLCQWREFIEDKINDVNSAAHDRFSSGKPCAFGKGMAKGGMPPPHGPFTNMHHGPNSHHHRPLGETGRPHHHNGHPKLHGGHHHHGHKFFHFLYQAGRFIWAVVMPIVIGIAAGLVTYTVGIIIGCVVAIVWTKLFRGGNQGYASVVQEEDDAANKDLDIDDELRASFESAPPVYEDAPAYEEKEVVQ